MKVVTHIPSPALEQCELTFLDSESIDIDKARAEHSAYCKVLEKCGAEVIILDENETLPDSVFVEDPIIVFDEVAVLTSMGVESRRKESQVMEKFFSSYRDVKRIELPAKIEGGDVLKIGKKVFVGLSPRTNEAGVDALRSIISVYGYEVKSVKVPGCLHLKTGCTALDEDTILINTEWIDESAFKDFIKVEVPTDEPFGANVLPIKNTLCMNAGFPKSAELVKSLGYNVVITDITEFVKAEAGLTCMSIPFKA